jgi:pimeloyl-ACP methyl ester carboxylesterase
VWVEADGRGDCIRYYTAGLDAQANDRAIIYIHGDRLWGDKPISYDDNSSQAQEENVKKMQGELGLPVIVVARPGTYGSSGSHAHRREHRELVLMKAAVEEIIHRHRIAKVGLTGQSGGGTVTSYVMGQLPDIQCVALTSAALSMKYIVAQDPQSIYDRGNTDLYDPISNLNDVLPSSVRRLFVIGAEGDKFSPFGNQKAYAQALMGRGYEVYVAEGEPMGTYKHTLDRTGRQTVAWCVNSVPPEAILEKIKARLIKG